MRGSAWRLEVLALLCATARACQTSESMHNVLTRLSPLAVIFVWSSLPLVAQAQHPPSHVVQPTVTVQAGDPGGKFFGRMPDATKTRRYYIAAEPELWDYAPQDSDPVMGRPLPPPLAAKRKVAKLRYVQYTDETFQAKVIQNPRLGVLGPALRGVVGKFLAVTFLNRTEQPLSLHPHGVKYDKDSEGAHYDARAGAWGGGRTGREVHLRVATRRRLRPAG